MEYKKRYDGPCADPFCYRGAVSASDNYQFADGPCNSPVCMWYCRKPYHPTRDHFSSRPAPPVVDAGKLALAARKGE
jgi:hypothetical protein